MCMGYEFRSPQTKSSFHHQKVVATLNSSLSEFANRRSNKVRILELIRSLIAGGSVSETILESLEAIEQIDRENREETPMSEKMKAAAAYCAVAVECTVADGDVKVELTDRIWRCRVLKLEISRKSQLVTDVLTSFRNAAECALWVAQDFVRFREVATEIDAADYVRSYLAEAMAAVIRDASSSSGQDPLPGSLPVGIPSTSLVSRPPEVQQACLDTLRSCVAKLQAAVNDPLPNARQVFESLSAEAPSNVERPVGNRDKANVDVLHLSSNGSVPEPSAQQGRQCLQTGQSSKAAAPVRHQNLANLGFITRGLVAHPSADASIPDIPAVKDKRKEVIISDGLEPSGQLDDEWFQIDQSNKAAASWSTAGSTHDSLTAEAVSKSGWMTRKNTAGSTRDSSTAEAPQNVSHPARVLDIPAEVDRPEPSLFSNELEPSGQLDDECFQIDQSNKAAASSSARDQVVSKSGLMTRKNTAGSTHDSSNAEAVSKSGLMTRKNTAGSTHDSSTAEAPQNIYHPASVLGIPAEVDRPEPSSSQKDRHESQQADQNKKAVGESSRHPKNSKDSRHASSISEEAEEKSKSMVPCGGGSPGRWRERVWNWLMEGHFEV